MTEADLYTFLRQSKLAVLGSVYNSSPQAALVGVAVTPQLELIFDTLNHSRKFRNLIAQPACSFVIGWSGEQTVQYEGKAKHLHSPELEQYQEVYFKTWPECRVHLSWPAIAYFVVRPTWIRFTDYDQSPPLIQEFTF